MVPMTNTEQRDTRTFILEQAISLFAAQGYSGASMRDLSKAVGLSAAAIYHHFPDKKTLYLEAMTHAFTDKATDMISMLGVNDPPLERLKHFIEGLTSLIDSDPNFRALVLRELLDNEEDRLKLVAEQVFLGPFQAVKALTEDFFPGSDPHMLIISMIGLVLFHFESAAMRTFLPGWCPEQSDPKTIAQHLIQLLTKSLDSDQNNLPKDMQVAR